MKYLALLFLAGCLGGPKFKVGDCLTPKVKVPHRYYVPLRIDGVTKETYKASMFHEGRWLDLGEGSIAGTERDFEKTECPAHTGTDEVVQFLRNFAERLEREPF